MCVGVSSRAIVLMAVVLLVSPLELSLELKQ